MNLSETYQKHKLEINTGLIIVAVALAFVYRRQLIYLAKLPYKLYTNLNNYQKIQTLNLYARPKLSQLVDDIENILGLKVTITSAFRSGGKQASLQKTPNSLAVGNSSHLYGLGIDLNVYDPKTKKTYGLATSKAEWDKTGVPLLASRLGIRWGGTFGTGYDPVHFDVVPKGFDAPAYLATLRKKAQDKFGRDWADKGNKLSLI